jgi:hypothetical protein
MRKLLIIFLMVFSLQAWAQPNMRIGLNASTIYDFSNNKIYEYLSSYTSINSYFPFRTGVDIMVRFPRNMSILFGYKILYQYMEVNLYTSMIGQQFNAYRNFTSEIPILFRYDGIQLNEHNGLSVEAGFSLDISSPAQRTFGKYRQELDYIVTKTWGYFYSQTRPTCVPSIECSIGLFNSSTKKPGFLELSVNFHYNIQNAIKNQFNYSYSDGIGNTTNDTYIFNTRNKYFCLSMDYYLPFKIDFTSNKKQEKT